MTSCSSHFTILKQPPKLGRYEVEGSFLFCAALLYYLDRDGIFLWLVFFCTLHELGHYAAIRLMGGRITGLRLSCAGAEMRLSAARPLSQGGMLLTALAGPGVNLVLALMSVLMVRYGLGERFYLLAGMNLALGLFNLLPVRWLDGGRALAAGLRMLDLDADGITRLCSMLAAGGVLLCGGWLLWESGGQNFSLFLIGVWMTAMGNQGTED